jgi:hypothetical protein
MKKQTSKDKFWVDESGNSIPYARLTALERKREKTAYALLQEAKFASLQLQEFKSKVADVCNEILDETMEEYKVKSKKDSKASKGNFSFFNFDRSIKVVVKVNEQIVFDDLLLKAAKEKLDEFLGRAVTSSNDYIKEMVLDAFETRGGKVDTKKVLSLIRYKSKINDALFNEAIDLIERGITKPSSKTYYQIFERNEDGSYDAINLDFAAI